MTNLERITFYNVKEKEVKNEGLILKKDFESYIADTSIPLVERWQLFINSSDNLKNHSSFLVHFTDVNLENYIQKKMSYYIHCRGKRYFISQLMEQFLINGVLQGFRYFDPDDEEDEDDYDEEEIAAFDKNLELALEEILLKNIGSFCYDW